MKSTPKSRKLERGAKTAFIRSNPDLSAPEVVARAARQGMVLAVSQVYNVRSLDRISSTHTLKRLMRQIGVTRSYQVLGELLQETAHAA